MKREILAKFTDQAGTNWQGIFSREEYNRLTWNPTCEIEIEIPLVVRGYSYKTKKEAARQLAIDVQHATNVMNLTWCEYAILGDFFRVIGERFHLMPEFIENGIVGA